jgi:murein DD-endopeptidase MepM/ murein hydrolase activator NlpD/uncharacterized protein YraI
MRGAIALLLASLLLLTGAPLAFADTDLDIGGTAVIANTGGDAILLRTDAGYQFGVLGHLGQGTTVTVVAGPLVGDDGNLWYRVDANGMVGYIFAAYLVRGDQVTTAAIGDPSSIATAQDTATKSVAGTGTDGLRLRDGADLSAAILTVAPEGASLTITGAPRLNGGQAWYPVVYAGISGWAVADYIGAASAETAPVATNQRALAITIGEHVVVSSTGGWDLRLRTDSSLDAGTIAAAPEGSVLRVMDGPLSDASGNAWYAVSYDGIEGYASAAYLNWTDAALSVRQSVAVAAAPLAVTGSGHAEVSNTGGWPLRLRADSSLDSGTIAAAPEGAVLKVTAAATYDDAGNAWYPVDYDGLQGYVGAAYLSATDAPLSARQPLATTVATSAIDSGAAFANGTHVAVSNTGGWDLRIRETAGVDGAVFGAATEGAVLLIVNGPTTDNQGNVWYGVNYDGVSGFARATYLTATTNALTSRPVALAATATAPEVTAAVPAPAVEPAPAPAAPPAALAPQATPAPSQAPAPQPTPAPAQAPSQPTGNFIYPAQGTFTQGFGGNTAFYGPGGHNGIDIANSVGTPVVASDAGVVTYAGWKGGLGNAVVIDHGNGFVTEYGHASALRVSVGQRVSQGQVIMAMGSTGNSTGSHVHFSIIRNGVYVNPMNYLSGR